MSTKTTKPTTDKKEVEPFKEFARLGEIDPGGRAKIHVRVIAGRDGKPVLDIRQHVESENYTGYTQKGVSIPADQLDELVELLIEEDGTVRDIAAMAERKPKTEAKSTDKKTKKTK